MKTAATPILDQPQDKAVVSCQRPGKLYWWSRPPVEFTRHQDGNGLYLRVTEKGSKGNRWIRLGTATNCKKHPVRVRS